MIEDPRFFKFMIVVCTLFSIASILLGFYEGYDLTFLLILTSFLCTGISSYIALSKLKKSRLNKFNDFKEYKSGAAL